MQILLDVDFLNFLDSNKVKTETVFLYMFESMCFDMTSARLVSSDYFFFQFIIVAFLKFEFLGSAKSC